MSIVELRSRPKRVVDSAVSVLEEILEKARAGDIAGVAVAALNTDGSINGAWSETDNFPALLGAIARLEHRININQNVE